MRKIKLAMLPLMAVFPGCTALPDASAPQACTLQKAAEIPVKFDRGFITADAEIDGKPVTMVVDTGAERLMVTPAAMTALALSPDRHRRTTINGTGGAVTSQNASLQSFAIGGMEMLDQSATVAPLPVLQGPSLHAAGLLGADWLSDFDVEIDLPHQRIALYRVANCGSDYVPWTGKTTSARLQIYGSGLALVPVILDGHALTALLDSGAASSTLGQAAAQQAGFSIDLTQDRKGHSMGVDGSVRETSAHRFGELQIAGERIANPVLVVGPLHLAMADMLLGADWLRRNRVWISYAGRRVTIQPTP